MRSITVLPLLIGLSLASSKHPATTYRKCQKGTKDPLDGCPSGTLYVSSNDPQADFSSIQSAIRSLPNDTSPQIIRIGAGIYTEQLNVTRPGPVHLLGESDKPWAGENYSDVTSDEDPQNTVQIFFNAANSATYPDNLYTSVLAVGPT